MFAAARPVEATQARYFQLRCLFQTKGANPPDSSSSRTQGATRAHIQPVGWMYLALGCDHITGFPRTVPRGLFPASVYNRFRSVEGLDVEFSG